MLLHHKKKKLIIPLKLKQTKNLHSPGNLVKCRVFDAPSANGRWKSLHVPHRGPVNAATTPTVATKPAIATDSAIATIDAVVVTNTRPLTLLVVQENDAGSDIRRNNIQVLLNKDRARGRWKRGGVLLFRMLY